MNLKIIAVVFACCCLALLTGSAEAVKCYVCNLLDAGCDDSFDSSKMTDANIQTGCMACSKSKSNIFGVTSRECSPKAEPYDGCQTKSADGQSGTACYCTSDLCNSSERVSMATIVLALPALAYIAFKLSFL